MKKVHNVKINSILLYAIFIFASNYLAYQASIIITNFFQPLVSKVPMALIAIFVFAIHILLGFAIPFVFIFFFLKSAVWKQYVPSDDRKCWIQSCLRLVLPAEIIRFLICQVTLGHIKSSGFFAYLPTLLFENTYLRWSGRSEQVRQKILGYNFADFLAYALCYVLYIAIHLVFVLLIYRHFWIEAQKDRDDLIVPESKVKYY